MPEGPEILYFASVLNKKLKNTTITNIKSFTDKPAVIPKDYIGKVKLVDCKGKLLWAKVTGKTQDYYIHIHFGITGWLQFDKPEKNIKFEFIIKKGNKEFSLYMEDQRRFSKIQVYNETLHNKIINELGIDIFSDEFTERKFKDVIKSKNLLLCAFLLNQHIFSGIGNYIKNDALYLSHIKVKSKTSELTDNQISKLYSNILFIAYSVLYELLRDSKAEKYLEKNKKTNEPAKLEVPFEYKVYSREKSIKGELITKLKIGGRDTYAVESQL
jgi:formamidopyrimidine-DNA glycosylase